MKDGDRILATLNPKPRTISSPLVTIFVHCDSCGWSGEASKIVRLPRCAGDGMGEVELCPVCRADAITIGGR